MSNDLVIEESGMQFGRLKVKNTYHLEVVDEYKRLKPGFKIAEFAYYKKSAQKIVILEAKKTFPNPNEGTSDDFKDMINEVADKFINSVDFLRVFALQKQLPEGYDQADYAEAEFRLYLVIKEHEKEWLRQVSDALNAKLSKILRLTHLSKYSCHVVNEHMATSRGMICAPDKAREFWE